MPLGEGFSDKLGTFTFNSYKSAALRNDVDI